MAASAMKLDLFDIPQTCDANIERLMRANNDYTEYNGSGNTY